VRLERVLATFPVGVLTKVSNGEPLQLRTRSGGWSEVLEPPEWVGARTWWAPTFRTTPSIEPRYPVLSTKARRLAREDLRRRLACRRPSSF